MESFLKIKNGNCTEIIISNNIITISAANLLIIFGSSTHQKTCSIIFEDYDRGTSTLNLEIKPNQIPYFSNSLTMNAIPSSINTCRKEITQEVFFL